MLGSIVEFYSWLFCSHDTIAKYVVLRVVIENASLKRESLLDVGLLRNASYGRIQNLENYILQNFACAVVCSMVVWLLLMKHAQLLPHHLPLKVDCVELRLHPH